MYDSPTKIALKPYLERIIAYCNALSKTELMEIVLFLAKEATVSERIGFLDKIESSLSKNGLTTDIDEDLLENIEALKEEIKERIESIEDGSYWDDADDLYDNYDDEDPDYASEEQIEELEEYFGNVEDLFLNDQLDMAREGYQALFQLLDGTGIDGSFDIDIREVRARYCRCIYDTVNKNKMLGEFLVAMKVDEGTSWQGNLSPGDLPLIQDVIDAKSGDMKDLNNFFSVWRDALKEKELSDRRALLMLETVDRLEGLEGITKLARTWKDRQPQGYQFWLQRLKEQNEWKCILDIGIEALPVIHKAEFREKIADFIIDAGQALKDKKYILKGKREKLFSRPNERNMLDLLDEAITQNCRDKELEKMLTFLKDRKDPLYGEESLLVNCLLAMGKLEEVFVQVKKGNSIGWSSDDTGIVFGSILLVLADYSEQAVTIKNLLKGYSERTTIYSGRFLVEDKDKQSTTFYKELKKGLSQTIFSKSDREKYLTWAIKIGQKRVEYIVSNQHRGAYERAAKVLGALAETYIAMGDNNKAIQLLHKYYNEEFKRHSAFRREVKSVVLYSDLLRDLGFS